MLSWTRFLLAMVCAVVALPGVITFQSIPLWKATLAVSEYGHRLALVPLVLALGCLRDSSWRGRFGMLACSASLTVLLLPLVLATFEARKLQASLDASFPTSSKTTQGPLSLTSLFLGSAPSVIEPRELQVPRLGEDLPILFFPGKGNGPSPCILVLHSGGWEHGRADEFPKWSHYWAGEGYSVASIAYRLAPEWPWPAQLDDVRDALAYLKSRADELRIDPSRFVLLGRSAGGQIATAAAHSLRDPAIRGCISLYAPADMVFAWQFADPLDVLDSPRLLRQYLGGSSADVPDLYRSASATLIANSDGPPTLMIHGRRDVLVWYLQSERLSARLKQVGVPHYFLSLPWATHAFDYPFNGPGSQLTRYAVDQFLSSTLVN